MSEAARHPHNIARSTFVELDGVVQPAPAPRFSRTPAATPRRAPQVGEQTDALLADIGLDAAAMRSAGVVR
jgi:alpha-methylacyl-CoA racemase